MPRSMTAFARVQESCDIGSIIWEIRSVNHRYLEPGLKLPDEFKALESLIRRQMTKYLTRGKVDFVLRYQLTQIGPENLQLNKNKVHSLQQAENELLDIMPGSRRLSVSDIFNWPGVIAEVGQDMSPLFELAGRALEQALRQLRASRETEGKALGELICIRCTQISDIVKQLRAHRPAMIAAIHEKWKISLSERMQKWAIDVSDSRLEQELAILAQKLDVDEELDRIDTHITEVENVLKRQEAVGRRLDFLMQELNREANTLSSKSQDSTTTQWSVDLKVLIEQMREQVQNIE